MLFSRNPICLAILEELGNPLLNTSATLEELDKPVLDGIDVEEFFGNRVDLILDGGEVYPNPSTVVSLLNDQPEVLREGQGDPSFFR